MCFQVEERNKKIKENMESQSEARVSSEYQTRMLSTMDLERNQTKLSLMHPIVCSLPSEPDFKTLDLSINVVGIPLLDKINLHIQAG